MTGILLGLVIVVALGVGALGVGALGVGAFRRRSGRGGSASGGDPWSIPAVRRRCLACHGTGWTGQEPERTFTFVGDGFEDKQSPATVCATCGGTGVAPDSPA